MTEANIEGSPLPETTAKSIFDKAADGISPELVAFLKLAEREGVYSRLTEQRRHIIEQYVIGGLSERQIAGDLKKSRQAVSQSLRLSPASMHRDMVQDVLDGKTQVSYTEIKTAYDALGKPLILRRRNKIG